MTSRQTKVCTKCGEERPHEDFHVDAQSKSGRRNDCKVCHNKQRQVYRDANREKRNAWMKKYYQRPEIKEKRRRYSREYNKKFKKKRQIQTRKYRKKNRKYLNALNALREAKKIQATPAWADIEGIMFFYACCPEGWHVDHEVPLAGEIASGLHTLDNLQYLPDKINIAKSNKWPWPEDLYDDKFN